MMPADNTLKLNRFKRGQLAVTILWKECFVQDFGPLSWVETFVIYVRSKRFW